MTVRDFLGFPSLQEVECSGGSLKAEVDLMSLKLFRITDNTVLAITNPVKNTCKTFSEYTSCSLNMGDTRKSLVRTLVTDLEEGETTRLGCNVTAFHEDGHAQMYSWSISVYRKRKCWDGLPRDAVLLFPVRLSAPSLSVSVNCCSFSACSFRVSLFVKRPHGRFALNVCQLVVIWCKYNNIIQVKSSYVLFFFQRLSVLFFFSFLMMIAVFVHKRFIFFRNV